MEKAYPLKATTTSLTEAETVAKIQEWLQAKTRTAEPTNNSVSASDSVSAAGTELVVYIPDVAAQHAAAAQSGGAKSLRRQLSDCDNHEGGTGHNPANKGNMGPGQQSVPMTAGSIAAKHYNEINRSNDVCPLLI